MIPIKNLIIGMKIEQRVFMLYNKSDTGKHEVQGAESKKQPPNNETKIVAKCDFIQ